MPRLLVTGSSGLVGSAVADHFCLLGWEVYGVDNNMRADFFGPAGDTRARGRRLQEAHRHFHPHPLDVRDRAAMDALVARVRPQVIVHSAAQPSHDLAAGRVFDDFDTNAGGTLNLLEAARRHCPEVVFVHLSTNKVYGDGPNRLPLDERPTRWEYADPAHLEGIDEDFPLDASMHSLFGASKLAADVLVQEYGRYFGMYTCCLRCGCLTGANQSGVELHGFLNYLVRTAQDDRVYRVFGYGGKQVRDNLHAHDVARFVELFAAAPRVAERYNLGGGRANSCSILEAFAAVEARTGRPVRWEYLDRARAGDHVCYISDLRRVRAHYPEWSLTWSLDDIFDELCGVGAAGGVR